MSAALFNQHAKHMRRIILSSLACLSLYNIFLHCLTKGTIVEKEILLNIK